jgi:hypothetical protein
MRAEEGTADEYPQTLPTTTKHALKGIKKRVDVMIKEQP